MKGWALIAALVITGTYNCFAGGVDTVNVYSTAMHKNINCVVVTPNGYKTGSNRLPVVYLLHGYSGNYADWIKKVPAIKNYADKYNLIIVCPDGAFSSWYFDSPVDSTMRYETYVGKEVPAYIDAHYRTIAGRHGRAITGLSMGGHGGLFLGLRHTETFGACGSMSGGVYLPDFKTQFDIDKRLGDTAKQSENFVNYSVMHLVDAKPAAPLHIIFDCGTDDFFYKINHSLHEKMVAMHIPHDYTERPGGHSWEYWANSIQYQLLYFSNYFSQAQ